MDSSNTFYGVTVDTIFTTFTTILIFFLGFIIARWFENKKNKKRLEDKKEFYLDTIKSIIEPMKQQADLYNNLVSQIDDDEMRLLIFEEKNELYINLSPFENSEDLYTIFVSQIKDKNDIKFNHYKSIVRTMSFIKEQRINAQNNYDSFFKHYRELEDDWNNSNGAIITYIQEEVSKLLRDGIVKTKDKLFSKIDDMTSKWQELENHWEINIVLENLIKPIHKICQDHFSDKRAVILLEYTRNSSTIHMNLMNLKKSHGTAFKYFAELTLARCKTIEEAYNYYTNN